MALTQITTNGIKDGSITGTDLATNIDLVDNQKLRLGTGNDLQIYHDGSNSYLEDVGTGKLILLSSQVQINNPASNETMANFIQNGAVELYHDDVKTFATKSGGNTLTGTDSSGNVSLGRFYYKTESGTVRALFDPYAQKFQHYDNTSASFGNSHDLQIYHDGSNSYIDNHQGDLIIRGDSDNIAIQPVDGENAIKCDPNEAVRLYYDNSQKFITTSTGATVTGNITASKLLSSASSGNSGLSFADNVQIHLGTSDDLQIYHDGSHSRIVDTGTGRLSIQSNDFRIENVASSELMAKFVEDGAVELYHDNVKKFETAAHGVSLQGELRIQGQTGAGTTHFNYLDQGNNYITQNDSGITYFRNASGTNRTFILGSGHWKWNDNYKIQLGTGSDLQIYHDGSHSYVNASGTGALKLLGNNNDDVQIQPRSGYNSGRFKPNGAVELYYDNSKKFETTSAGVSVTGALTASGNVTAFSDVTLKEDINTISNALNKVLNLRGVSYSRKDTKQKGIGVVAQEIEKVLPEVVENGEFKSVAYGNIVALLIEAIKDLNTQIKKLKK